jgi:hypothetical protein
MMSPLSSLVKRQPPCVAWVPQSPLLAGTHGDLPRKE